MIGHISRAQLSGQMFKCSKFSKIHYMCIFSTENLIKFLSQNICGKQQFNTSFYHKLLLLMQFENRQWDAFCHESIDTQSIDIFDLIRLDSKPKPKKKISKYSSINLPGVQLLSFTCFFKMKVGHCFGLQFPKWTTTTKKNTHNNFNCKFHVLWTSHWTCFVSFSSEEKQNYLFP